MISPLAIVAPWVEIGPGVTIHPFAVIGRLPDASRALARQPVRTEALRIGAGTVIGPHAVIYGGSVIGADCLIGDHASIREGVWIGHRCVIGRSVTVHYDAMIGDDVRLIDGAHITGGCRIGAGCFFGPGAITCNDRNIDLYDYAFRGASPPVFGRRVMVGAGAIILPGVEIGDAAVIGAGAIVSTNVAAGVRMLGQRATAR